METIQYLLGKIVKIVVLLFLMVFVLMLIGSVYPTLQVSKLLSFSIFEKDWLPAPKNYALGSVQQNPDGTYGTVYQHGEAFNGYNMQPNRYITYSYNGQMPTTSPSFFSGETNTHTERMRYIRNLSLYEGVPINHGQTIYGEARSDMFRNGIFQIVITDRAGRPITAMYAMNLGTWSVPGWSRWKAVVPVRLPKGVDCVLVFISSDGIRTSFPVRCD